MPTETGCVRVSRSPPIDVPQHKLPLEERYLHVPACLLKKGNESIKYTNKLGRCSEHPLAITFEQTYVWSDYGVVSTKTFEEIGHNGINIVVSL